MAASSEALLREVIASMERGDVGALDALITNEQPVLFIGTDSSEWWDDRARLLEVFKSQVAEMGFPKATVGAVTSVERGDVGWSAGKIQLQIPDGPTVDMRFTVVAVKEAGEWKLAQAHASVGAPNEETVGTELTV